MPFRFLQGREGAESRVITLQPRLSPPSGCPVRNIRAAQYLWQVSESTAGFYVGFYRLGQETARVSVTSVSLVRNSSLVPLIARRLGIIEDKRGPMKYVVSMSAIKFS